MKFKTTLDWIKEICDALDINISVREDESVFYIDNSEFEIENLDSFLAWLSGYLKGLKVLRIL